MKMKTILKNETPSSSSFPYIAPKATAKEETLPKVFPLPEFPAPRRVSMTTKRSKFRSVIISFFTEVWNTRLALRIFGSKKEIEQEEIRIKNIPYVVIHPCSKFRILWDFFMIIILGLNVLLIPVACSFFRELINVSWLIFTTTSDILFATDIVFNFWTGFITTDNHVILELKTIRKVYIRKWLLIDVISVIPFDFLTLVALQFHTRATKQSFVDASTALRLLRLLKLLSMVKIFRVFRFVQYLAKWEELFNATRSIVRVAKFIIAVLVLCHWNACVQFLIPFLQGFPSNSWVSINQIQNASISTQYSLALFKAISHMLCIGFGRWPPQNITEVWITIISMLIGASLYAMFIGHMATLINTVDSASRQYDEKLKQVREYISYRKLPPHLKQKMYEYYYQKYHGHLFNELGILNELSHSLKEEIVSYTCQELIRVVPFFAKASNSFIRSIITRVTFEIFLPDDYVIRCGSNGTKMYFIQHGILDVLNRDKKVAGSLCDGSYFGEVCLLFKCRQIATYRAVTVCSLYSLLRDDFDLVLQEFPKMRTMMKRAAEERLEMLKDTYPPGSMSLNEMLFYDSPGEKRVRISSSSHVHTLKVPALFRRYSSADSGDLISNMDEPSSSSTGHSRYPSLPSISVCLPRDEEDTSLSSVESESNNSIL